MITPTGKKNELYSKSTVFNSKGINKKIETHLS